MPLSPEIAPTSLGLSLLLAPGLAAGCGDKSDGGGAATPSGGAGEDGGSDPVGTDGDGDGYLATVDCDDGDAAIYPSATEVWYDGVDQDCDGADDDQDGDGVAVAEDCDDTNPAAYPGAGEVPEDGVDQDCDGVDQVSEPGPDAADADGDGYAGEAYHGTDCDDTEADVHPDAAEAVGDGVDSDCDGADFGAADLEEGDLVITEIMYDPDAVSDSVGEWFEVYNGSGASVNLRGLSVADDAAFDPTDIFTVDEDLVAEPGARLVFSVNGDVAQNGGIPTDFDFPGGGVNFNNGADDLYLGVEGGGAMRVIDAVAYDELAGWPMAKGLSIELKDTQVTSAANDTAGNWCLANVPAGDTTDQGSPGEASSGC